MKSAREEVEKIVFGYLDLDKLSQDVGDLIDKLTTLTAQKDAVADVPCSMGLVALRNLSNGWREGANDVTAPPQDETDFPKHDIAETLLNCADELDGLIEEMSN